MNGEVACGTRRQGAPLVALGALLGAWVAARVMFWEMSGLSAELPPEHLLAGGEPRSVQAESMDRLTERKAQAYRKVQTDDGLAGPFAWPVRPYQDVASAAPERQAPLARPFVPSRPLEPVRPVPVDVAIGHHSLWMAALSRVPLPWQIGPAQSPNRSLVPFRPAGDRPDSASRWSADAWLLLRRGGTSSLASGAGPATYGASQAGGVVRYRLAPGNAHKPAAYLRATGALTGAREQEAALGIAVRPLGAVPVVAAVELRASEFADGTRVRPAAFVVTELPRFKLPHGMRAEAYAQAGYVGGKFSTPFADGQARVDRRVADLGPAELRAGAGAWAGVQKGAGRIDVGPTATIGFAAGKDVAARVAVDWRFRVAGNAAPESGPALTLSAGF